MKNLIQIAFRFPISLLCSTSLNRLQLQSSFLSLNLVVLGIESQNGSADLLGVGLIWHHVHDLADLLLRKDGGQVVEKFIAGLIRVVGGHGRRMGRRWSRWMGCR
jgi:hypothetical protein